MKKFIYLALFATSMLAACDQVPTTSAERSQQRQTDQLQRDAEARVGMPRVTNFTEKRLANMIVELRDEPNLATFSYLAPKGSAICFLGKSIGYGLPYTTQITNPSKSLDDKGVDGGDTVLPQAEPNGLYSSDSTDATWVLLVGPDGKPQPSYVEADVITTLAPMASNPRPC